MIIRTLSMSYSTRRAQKSSQQSMIKIIISAFLVAVLTACASPAMQQSMQIGVQDLPTTTSPKLKGKINVRNVSGGKDTNPLWTSQVDSQGFKTALEQSLATVGYQNQNTQQALYQVDAVLQDLSQPMFGVTFDVHSTVLYTVSSDGQSKVFPITATGTATASDKFMAVERLRIANERSIRENIKKFIQNISDQFK